MAEKEEKKEAATPPAEETAPPAEEPTAAAAGKKRLWPWLLLVFIALGATAAAFLISLQPPWLQSMLARLPAAPQPTAQPQPPAKTAPTAPKAAPASEKDKTIALLQEEVAQLKERLADVEANEAKRLAQLEERLGNLEAEHQRWRQATSEMQRLNLRMLLARIADADSNAAAVRLAWKQITLLPLLTPQERDRAVKLAAKAQKLAADIAAWRDVLHQLAASLPLTEGQGTAAVPEWLKPIAPYFRISPSPRRAQTLLRLHTQLLQSSHLLALGLWPDKHSWQRLRKQAAELGSEKLAARLPEDFTEARLAREQLRQAAADWLGKL